MPQHWRVNALVLTLLLLAPAPLDGLVVEEESTESLANTLLDFSVACRAGDASKLEPWLARRLESFAMPAPGEAPPERLHALVTARTWEPAAAKPRSRAQAIAGLQGLFDRFGLIEDVRWKVTGSLPAGPKDRKARFKCWFVGRAPDGRRLWLKGKGDLAARLDEEGHWRLTALAFTEASSKLGEREIFTECSEFAGVARAGVALKDRTELLRSYGAAAADVDGDGDQDVFATAPDRGRLYLNQGDGTFREAAAEARVAAFPRPFLQPLFLDHDGDGDLDLFLTAVGAQALFENRLVPDGELRFRDVSAGAGVEVFSYGHSASAGDVNGDGRPDVYVNSYGDYPRVVPDSWDGATNGTPNLLFLNLGDGRFREAAKELGVADSRWSYASALVDFDDDGDLDLTVANDFGGAVGLFLNRGEVEDGPRFVDVAAERGLGGPAYGMGISYGDPDRDGDLDLHVTKMSSTAGNRILDRVGAKLEEGEAALRLLAHGNDLYENLGDGSFRSVTKQAGGLGAGWAWGGGFLDVDNDGRVDLYAPNGFLSGELLKDT